MSTSSFFHGVQVVEVESSARTIQTLSSSVIGLVGTAPGAQVAAAAAALFGVIASNNAFGLTAAKTGAAGNAISLQLRAPSTANAALSVQVAGNAITIFLATGATAGVVTTTISQLLTALAASAPATALVTGALTGGSDGTGLAASISQTNLTGGLDDVAPYDTPTTITPAQAGLFGVTGSLPQALADIFSIAEVAIVVVRVQQHMTSDTDPTTITNVIGANTAGVYTGLKALLTAENVTGLHPRIIIAPGFSSTLSVAAEMGVEANLLRAIRVIAGPGTTNAAAIAYMNNFGDSRTYMVEPGAKVNGVAGGVVNSDGTASVAGLIAWNDAENGFWTSPSNETFDNVLGTTRGVSFSLNDPTCDANTLNAANIATIVNFSGFRLWGNRTASLDPAFAFLSVRRTADIIEDSIQRSSLTFVDKNIGKAYFQEVVSSVQGYLDSLKALGAILDGSITADPDLNTVANLAAGKAYFDVSFTPPAPGENITFRVNPVATTGYANILA